MTTLPDAVEQLRRRYDRPCLPLDEVRAEWLPHINSEEHLMRQIHQGHIRLRYTRLHSRKGIAVVYLDDLARWLLSRKPSNTNGTTRPADNLSALNSEGDTA